MSDGEPIPAKEHITSRGISWTFRSIVAINFVRLGLSFWPRFEGTGEEAGVANRIFGTVLGGFRVDFIWLVLSTLLIFASGVAFLVVSGRNHQSRVDAVLAAAWVVTFVAWIIRLALTNHVDFG